MEIPAIISQRCSLGDPFKKCSRNFYPSRKHGSSEWGLLAVYEHEEIHLGDYCDEIVRFYDVKKYFILNQVIFICNVAGV